MRFTAFELLNVDGIMNLLYFHDSTSGYIVGMSFSFYMMIDGLSLLVPFKVMFSLKIRNRRSEYCNLLVHGSVEAACVVSIPRGQSRS